MQYLPCLLHNPDKSDRAVPYNLRKEDHDSRLGFTFMSFSMRAEQKGIFL